MLFDCVHLSGSQLGLRHYGACAHGMEDTASQTKPQQGLWTLFCLCMRFITLVASILPSKQPLRERGATKGHFLPRVSVCQHLVQLA